MACNFIAVTSVKDCIENFSGVGSKFYVFDGREIDATSWSTADLDEIGDFEKMIQTAISEQTVYEIQIKPKSGKVTSTSNPNGGGFTNVYTCSVSKNMQDMTEIGRTLNNLNDWGVLVPCGAGKFYVLYDKDFGVEFQMESDSGDASDSDHGHTITITCGPMLYAMPKISIEIDNLVIVSSN